MAQPCLNLATCFSSVSLPFGYMCLCVPGYSGYNCEIDNRTCRAGYSCLYGGTCNQTVGYTNCHCPYGKNGEHCESEIDACTNVTCENRGQCVSSFGNWTCRCINDYLYSGTLCEHKSSYVVIREIVSRSFAAVAIGCMSAVVSFVIIMDVLKYCFHIDPVETERNSYRENENSHQREKERERRRKMLNGQQPSVALRFQYIHA